MKPIKSTLFNMIFSFAGRCGRIGFHPRVCLPNHQRADCRSQNRKTLDAIREVVGSFDNDPFAEKTTITTPDGKYKLQLYPARENGTITAVAIRNILRRRFWRQSGIDYRYADGRNRHRI